MATGSNNHSSETIGNGTAPDGTEIENPATEDLSDSKSESRGTPSEPATATTTSGSSDEHPLEHPTKELSREELQKSQESILREHEALSQKYKEEKQKLINKEIELTEQEKHPRIEKDIANLSEDRERKLKQSERVFDASVAVINEQYESKRQQIDSDYTAALTELDQESLEKRRRLMKPEGKREEDGDEKGKEDGDEKSKEDGDEKGKEDGDEKGKEDGDEKGEHKQPQPSSPPQEEAPDSAKADQ